VKTAQRFCVRAETSLPPQSRRESRRFAAANFHIAPCAARRREYSHDLSLMDRAIRPKDVIIKTADGVAKNVVCIADGNRPVRGP
jgi:hypothetical protein